MYYFTSDTHYFHPNIILYTKRPYLMLGAEDTLIDDEGKLKWASKERARHRAVWMTEDLVEKHNAIVTPKDTVYHLGDFTFGGAPDVIWLLNRLNGDYKFIWGNHDKAIKEFKAIIYRYPMFLGRIEFLGDMKEIVLNSQKITLCHYAMRTWNKSHHKAWQLYGHSHGTLPDDPNSLSLDVGVDCHDYVPISFEQVGKLMAKKKFKPIDHHAERS